MTEAAPFLPAGSFDGRVAFVTGGGTGLGLAVSTRLGRLGASVACASRSTDHHAELLRRGQTEGFRVLSLRMDVRDAHEVKQAFRRTTDVFGGLDVLVNNAAGNFIRPAIAMPPKAFANVIDIALSGVFTCSHYAARAMREEGGSIVNVSAPYSSTGKPGVVHSACAKAGVEAMTRTLAAEWAVYGIRVNAVSPGPFESRGAADRLWPSREIEDLVRGEIPLGRFGTAEEVGELVCFLASPSAAWITGSTLIADGGWILPKPMAGGLQRIDRRREEQ
jgi:NAD(P)-dependent dehydrogenase (short-subunit alcohol dehydrogenase family)